MKKRSGCGLLFEVRIAFVTSSLAPGQDGVGDYTRRLAAECRRRGHACAQVAVNDRWAPVGCARAVRAAGAEAVEAGEVGELRLSAAQPWRERLAEARQFLECFKPNWVSWQFVGYGYHPKGLVHGWARRLRPLVNGRRLHLMFHELWIGAELGAPWKARVIGALQRRAVLGLVRRLRPHVVQTTNRAYQVLLHEEGLTAGRLPLFGNVPVVDGGDPAWVLAGLQAAGIPVTRENRSGYWLAGFFGTLHPVWPPEPFVGRFRAAAAAAGKVPVLCGVGRIGAGGALWESMRRQYAGALGCWHAGEQSAERISNFLHAMDFGVATTPWVLLGKSATVAAMLEHGLPVIVNRDDVQFGCQPELPAGSPLAIRMAPDLAEQLRSVCRQPARPTLAAVTESLLYELQR